MSQLLPIVGPTGSHLAGSHPTGSYPEADPSIITIQKARLKDGHLSCEFTEQRTQEAPARAFALSCLEQAHPDLSHRLSRLVPHLCLLTEQLTETADYWPDEAEEQPARFQSFTVTSFSLGKNESGVTLIGQRTLTGGKVLNLTGPYVSFDDDSEAAYPYAPLLEAELSKALAEVEAALRGKCTDYRQLDLFDGPLTTTADMPLLPLVAQS